MAGRNHQPIGRDLAEVRVVDDGPERRLQTRDERDGDGGLGDGVNMPRIHVETSPDVGCQVAGPRFDGVGRFERHGFNAGTPGPPRRVAKSPSASSRTVRSTSISNGVSE